MRNNDHAFGRSGPARPGQDARRFGATRPGPLDGSWVPCGWAVLLFVAFTFSLVLFAVLVAVGLTVWAYLWWKTRALRQHLREQMGEPMAEAAGRSPPGGRDRRRSDPRLALARDLGLSRTNQFL